MELNEKKRSVLKERCWCAFVSFRIGHSFIQEELLVMLELRKNETKF